MALDGCFWTYLRIMAWQNKSSHKQSLQALLFYGESSSSLVHNLSPKNSDSSDRTQKLYYLTFTFFFKIEFSLTVEHPLYHHLPVIHFYDCAIIKVYVVWPITVSLYIVHPKVYFWLNLTVDWVPSSLEVIRSYRWMMTDLFNIHGTFINPKLKCLS